MRSIFVVQHSKIWTGHPCHSIWLLCPLTLIGRQPFSSVFFLVSWVMIWYRVEGLNQLRPRNLKATAKPIKRLNYMYIYICIKLTCLEGFLWWHAKLLHILLGILILISLGICGFKTGWFKNGFISSYIIYPSNSNHFPNPSPHPSVRAPIEVQVIAPGVGATSGLVQQRAPLAGSHPVSTLWGIHDAPGWSISWKILLKKMDEIYWNMKWMRTGGPWLRKPPLLLYTYSKSGYNGSHHCSPYARTQGNYHDLVPQHRYWKPRCDDS